VKPGYLLLIATLAWLTAAGFWALFGLPTMAAAGREAASLGLVAGAPERDQRLRRGLDTPATSNVSSLALPATGCSSMT